MMQHLTIDELVQQGRLGNEAALLALGRKVLDMDVHEGPDAYILGPIGIAKGFAINNLVSA